MPISLILDTVLPRYMDVCTCSDRIGEIAAGPLQHNFISGSRGTHVHTRLSHDSGSRVTIADSQSRETEKYAR
jgi:hypothetical protein